MSDMVYTYMNVAETMCYATINGLFRAQEKTIEFNFRLDHSCYRNGEDIGKSILWKVRYINRKGSRYVKVDWTPCSYHEDIENWQEIADHDSCWCGCWGDILDYGRKELIDNFTAKGNESWFFNCELVREIENAE